jgi:arabinose-5-phosphate isomerase
LKTQDEILALGIQALNDEIDGLVSVKDNLGKSFTALVNAILNTEGRIILSGIGKSAIIAHKITATFNSTGTPAFFMHAAEAIHGDLGMVQKNDFILILSHSGNTPEIKYLADLVQKMGNNSGCITGNSSSNLFKASNFPLAYTIQKEACPLNLAPTTSTTIQLALGDALAVALLSSRKFSANDFSRFHPGGNLGKKLYLTCGELATRNLVPKVQSQSSVKDVIMEISSKRIGATSVFEGEKLVGVITDGDIRRMLQDAKDINSTLASDIMNTYPKTIKASVLAVNANHILKEYKISQLVVLDDNEKYCGMIHLHDLLREGIAEI